MDDPEAEVEMKPQLKPGAAGLRKATHTLPTSCARCRVSPHDLLSRLCLWKM